MRGDGFKANTPDHANNDHRIDKQHGGGHIFAGIQRLTKQVIKGRQPTANPHRNQQFFDIDTLNKQQQQQRQKRNHGDRKTFPQLHKLNVDQQVQQRQHQIATDSDRTRHTPPASVGRCKRCGCAGERPPATYRIPPARSPFYCTAPAAGHPLH
ncbi:hypothetical protein D3C73_979290 [compost metagenome]